jgi:hypothetical protein
VTRQRPGRLWLFFYGRRRRGFPGLLVAVILLAIVLGLSFASRIGAGLSWLIGVGFVAALAFGVVLALAAFGFAGLRPPRRR